MECPADAIFVFETHRRMVVYLMFTFKNTIYCATSKGNDPFGAGTDPPVHQVKMVAVFIDETASRSAFVLNPIVGFFLKRPTKLTSPDHVWQTDFARVDEVFNFLEIRGEPEFMAENEDSISFVGVLNKQ